MRWASIWMNTVIQKISSSKRLSSSIQNEYTHARVVKSFCPYEQASGELDFPSIYCNRAFSHLVMLFTWFMLRMPYSWGQVPRNDCFEKSRMPQRAYIKSGLKGGQWEEDTWEGGTKEVAFLCWSRVAGKGSSHQSLLFHLFSWAVS